MDEIDKKIEDIYRQMKKIEPNIKNSPCPGDETLSLYINGALKEDEKERIEQHLTGCDDCLELLVLYNNAGDDTTLPESTDVPAQMKKNAINLFAGKAKECKTGIFDIVLKFAKEAVEVVSNPGNLQVTFNAMPMAVRSENTLLSPNHIILSKAFSDMESKIEIEKVDDLNLNMKITTIDTYSKMPVNVLRISLFNPLRELASYITDNGEVYFGNLNYGEYKVNIIKDSEKIGQISLNITLN